MEKTQKEHMTVNISWFLRKFILYFGLLYNIVWGAIFGILLYKRNESDNCEDVMKWGIGCFSFCIINPVKTYLLNLTENKSSETCKSISGFQNIFFITESINIVFFCIILFYVVIKKHRENNMEGDGMISIKTID